MGGCSKVLFLSSPLFIVIARRRRSSVVNMEIQFESNSSVSCLQDTTRAEFRIKLRDPYRRVRRKVCCRH